MRTRLTVFLVFGAILVALGEWDAQTRRFGFAEGLGDAWREFCVANSRDRISDAEVSLVRINDEYEPAIGNSLSQADYAAILRFVSQFDPKTVAFEPNPVFDPNEPINQTTLELLKEAALTLPELTLGAVAENGQAPEEPEEAIQFPYLEKISGDVSTITPVTRVVDAPDPQLLANGQPAFTEIELAGDTAGDDRGRRINLLARHGDRVVASFVVASLARVAEVPLAEVEVNLPEAGAGQGTIVIGDRYRIPIDAKGRMKAYEQSGIGTDFYPTVSAFHLALTGDEDETIQKLLADVADDFDSLRSHLVVIGHDRQEDRREELSTASRALSRSELLTRAVATIQTGRYIDWWPFWARLLSVAAIALVALWAFRGSAIRAVAVALVGAFLYFGLSLVIFKSQLLWAPPFAPLALFALMIIVAIVLPAAPASVKKNAGEEGGDGSESASSVVEESES